MLNQVKAVADFILSSMTALGEDNVKGVVQAQVKHLISVISDNPPSVVEASGLLKALGAPGGDDAIIRAFPDEDRKALASAVVSRSSGAVLDLTKAPAQTTKQQVHDHMCNYMTKSDWDILTVVHTTMEAKIRTVTDRALKIGLTYPSEKTFASMVNMMVMAANVHAVPDMILKITKELKRVLRMRRKGHERTEDSFPEDVMEFMVDYPQAYEDDVPAPPPFDPQTLQERPRLCRGTHSSLKQPAALPVMDQAAMMQAWGAMMQNSRPPKQKDIGLTFLGPAAGMGGQSVGQAAGMGGQSMGQAALPALPAPFALPDSPPQLAILALGDSPPQAAHQQKPSPPAKVATPQDHGVAAGPGIDCLLNDMKTALFNKRKREDEEEEEEDGGDPAVPKTVGGGKGKGRGKGRGKGGTKGKAKAKAAAMSSEKKTGAKAKAKAAAMTSETKKGASPPAKPSVGTVWSRSNVVARTGKGGAGQSKTFSYKTEALQPKAFEDATIWLRKICKENGIKCTL